MQPDVETFNALIASCEDGGRWEQAEVLFGALCVRCCCVSSACVSPVQPELWQAWWRVCGQPFPFRVLTCSIFPPLYARACAACCHLCRDDGQVRREAHHTNLQQRRVRVREGWQLGASPPLARPLKNPKHRVPYVHTPLLVSNTSS